ncbi:hypothetical protein Ahy_A04g017295 [Arachis hypogaea]|uniref:F-box domain-containing protein n=1 Tax=Arachis hypogaea TaxID=3818 RepID=A0A445DAP5_ARAHY|nr:hypothetical protein Ahy_A04g017295 [Arachis hypogaea]
MEKQHEGMDDIIPVELIHRILLRVPAKHLARLRKEISYPRVVSRCKDKGYRIPREFHVYGFSYDASEDDYLLVVACHDMHGQAHFNCLSLRTNSFIYSDAAPPQTLAFAWSSRGLFLNGAIHWVPSYLKDYRDAILIFDLKERTLSRISGPEQLLISACLMLLSSRSGPTMEAA